MTPARLRALGRAIWGRSWVVELAAALSIHPVTVKRWACGATEMSVQTETYILAFSRRWSEERHRVVRKLVRSGKTALQHRRLLLTAKVEPPVLIQPWRKFKKRHIILEDF
jgi:hypothetical protein